MEFPRELVREYLAACQKRNWSGVVYCHRFGDYPPDRVNIVGGRWNPKEIPAIYFSHDEETARAEGDYMILMSGVPLKAGVKRYIYEARVSLDAVLELPLDDLRQKFQITRDSLFGDSLTVSQAIGDLVDYLDFNGLIVPSARSANKNLVVYTHHTPLDWEIEVLSKREL